jgi:hypothetical protein
MIKAMELRNFSPRTHTAYLSAVTILAKHYKKSPEGITQEEADISLFISGQWIKL